MEGEQAPVSLDRILQSINEYSRLQGAGRMDSGEKPVEVFRKDLISAMKMSDADPLLPDEYWPLADNWRMEWETGVQVPVDPDNSKHAKIVLASDPVDIDKFKMPTKKIHAQKDETFEEALHELSVAEEREEETCRYDLDDMDTAWLTLLNQERQTWGQPNIIQWTMEKIMEKFEITCHENFHQKLRNSEGLGIEYDDDVVCDVCQMPDSEDGNEMIFCDGCDICVHQACYGVSKIPEGSWLCRVCAIGLPPQQCILCPKKGGAMKSTRSGTKWAHVSCALWIPEISIGDPEKMEPITKISQVPSSRWGLCCALCREKVGAPIQCILKKCKTAFHVTCAFEQKLVMKTIFCGDDEEDVQLRGYCLVHSKTEHPEEFQKLQLTPRKPGMTKEEKEETRQQRIQALEEEFYTLVEPAEVAEKLNMDKDLVTMVYSYWKLKRKSKFNKALMVPKAVEASLLNRQQEDSLVARMRMFVRLRQDLERVRNLCYMVVRREKMTRMLYNAHRDLWDGQKTAVVEEGSTDREATQVAQMGHKLNIYDYPAEHLKTAAVDDVMIAADMAERAKLLEEEKPNNKFKALKSPHKRAYKRRAEREAESGGKKKGKQAPVGLVVSGGKKKNHVRKLESDFGSVDGNSGIERVGGGKPGLVNGKTARKDSPLLNGANGSKPAGDPNRMIVSAAVREGISRNIQRVRFTRSFVETNGLKKYAQTRLEEYFTQLEGLAAPFVSLAEETVVVGGAPLRRGRSGGTPALSDATPSEAPSSGRSTPTIPRGGGNSKAGDTPRALTPSEAPSSGRSTPTIPRGGGKSKARESPLTVTPFVPIR